MNGQQNGDRNKHTHDADQASEIPAVVMIDREDMTIGKIINGLFMGHPENLQLENVPPIALKEIDHVAFETILKTSDWASDWLSEPTAEEVIALFQQCIFWLHFFAALLYQPAPESEEDHRDGE